MSDELPPLPDELAFLREVEPPSPPPGFEDAVAAKLATSWAVGTVAKGLSLAKLISGGAALLLTGVGLGVVLDRTVFQPAPIDAGKSVEVRVEVPPPPVVIDAGVIEPKHAVTAPKPEGSRDLSLSAERGLLEVARSALAKGDLPGAFAALEQHERDFANGRLEEEREALLIKTLHTAGREREATERATRFQQRFPDSLLMP
jgi:hypothetical protein